MIRKNLISGCLLVLLHMSSAYALPSYSSGVYLENLAVESVSQTRITLSGNVYAVSPKAKIQDTRYGEMRDIRLSDIRVGEVVGVRAEGTTITEIYILRN